MSKRNANEPTEEMPRLVIKSKVAKDFLRVLRITIIVTASLIIVMIMIF